jgi:hypothetical protein
MKGERRALAAVLASLATALVLPGAAMATVTIGSNLQHTTFASTACLPNCTVILGDLAPDAREPAGIASPVNGTVVRWRLGVGNESSPTAFRVARRLADGTYSGGGTSAVVTPALETVNVFPTSLPIQRGDLIGIDCCAAPGVTYFSGNHTGERVFFEPGFLGEGGAGATPSGTDTFEMLLNADIEPTSAFTLTGGKAKRSGPIAMTADLPNQGSLEVATTRFLRGLSEDAGPGPVSLRIPVTKKARALARKRGRLRVQVSVTFTPTAGEPATQTAKLRLKG